MNSGNKTRKFIIPIIIGACTFTLFIVTIFSTVYYIASPVINVVNAISDFFSSLNVSTTDTGTAIDED